MFLFIVFPFICFNFPVFCFYLLFCFYYLFLSGFLNDGLWTFPRFYGVLENRFVFGEKKIKNFDENSAEDDLLQRRSRSSPRIDQTRLSELSEKAEYRSGSLG